MSKNMSQSISQKCRIKKVPKTRNNKKRHKSSNDLIIDTNEHSDIDINDGFIDDELLEFNSGFYKLDF